MSRVKGDRIDPPDHYDECLDNDSGECICNDLDEGRAEARAEAILDDLEWDRTHP
jgi:hypothetical protein